MFTPKGLSVRSRIFTISARTASSSPDDVSMMPRPPALETAEASCARAIHPIGAWTIGCSMPRRSVTRVRMAAVSPLSVCPAQPPLGFDDVTSAASMAVICSGAAGGLARCPCSSPHPSARSSTACSLVSTPSATQTMPRPLAMPATAATMARSSAFSVTPCTKERSILIMSTENWRTKLSEENPVPKSSSARPTPRSFTSRRRAHAATVSSSIVPSVSSRHSPSGRRPAALSALATVSRKSGSASCRADTFTVVRNDETRKCRDPLCGLTARLPKHPPAHVDDQPRLFELRNEVARHDDPERRMVPAQQGFDPDDRAVEGRDHRLIDETELLLCESQSQLFGAACSRARTHG